jgi:hypothetical protein
MVIHRRVKKLNDFMFVIVPGYCPAGPAAYCETCAHSCVEFKIEEHETRTASFEIAYVTCSHSEAKPSASGMTC